MLYENGGVNKFIIPIFKDFENPKCNKKVKNDNDNIFLKLIDKLPDIEIEDFLNFHYDEFSGEKKLFLIHTEQIINNDTWIIRNNTKKEIVKQWIEIQNIINDKLPKLAEKQTQINKPTTNKEIPLFKDLFEDTDYHKGLLEKLSNKGKIKYNDINGNYIWEKSKTQFAELFHKLKELHKINQQYSNQDCARSFCKFFNTNYNGTIKKLFQPNNSILTQSGNFHFITRY